MKKYLSLLVIALFLSSSLFAFVNVKPVCSSDEHDLAVTHMMVDFVRTWHGLPMRLNTTIANLGMYNETFNLTICCTIYRTNDSYVVKEIDGIHLASNTSAIVTITWDGYSSNLVGINGINDFPVPTFTIYRMSANVTSVANETDTTNNTYVGGLIEITQKGDINGDGFINVLDLILVASKLGQTKPFGYTYPIEYRVDANNDSVVNLLDLIVVARCLDGYVILP